MKRVLCVVFAACGLSCSTPFTAAPLYVPAAIATPETAESSTPGSSLPDSAERGPQHRWTLAECLQAARSGSRTMSIERHNIAIAEARLDEALGRVLPSLSAQARYDARSNDIGVRFGGAAIKFGDRGVANAGATLLVPLYDFGRATSARDALKANVAAAHESGARSEQDLVFLVTRAFFRALEAHAVADVVRESIRVTKRQLQVVRDFRAQELVAANDVLVVEVRVAERQQDLIQAQHHVALIGSQLNRLMGRDVDAPLRLARLRSNERPLWNADFRAAVQIAIRQRPDLAAQRKRVEAARTRYQSSVASFAPQLAALGSFNYTTDSTILNRAWFSAGVGVSIPIFDWSRVARLRGREHEIGKELERYAEHVDDVVFEVKRATLRFTEAEQQLPVASRRVEAAQESLRVVEAQYGEGLLSSADVLAAEDRLARARLAALQAQYQLHIAFAELTHALGGGPPPSR